MKKHFDYHADDKKMLIFADFATKPNSMFSKCSIQKLYLFIYLQSMSRNSSDKIIFYNNFKYKTTFSLSKLKLNNDKYYILVHKVL